MTKDFPGNLEPVTFAEADPAPILDRLIRKYEADTGKTLYPGDPERLLLNSAAYELAVAYSLLDFTGKQNLLAYTTGAFEDQVGAFHAVERLQPSAARVVQRFYAEPGLAFPVTVSDELRVSPDSQLFFKVAETVVIPAASSPDERPFVDVAVECLTPGAAGNGFPPGAVKVLVDPRPFIAATENIEVSAGGADIEDDERFRRRIYLAPEGFSTAGPEGAYQYWTYTASQAIADVAVISPRPCYIEVYPLLSDGGLPDEALLNLVDETLAPRDRRPMGDRVSVLRPLEVPYAIQAVYYVRRGNSGRIDSIQAAVARAGEEYAAWQRGKLGRDIVPEELSSRVLAAGAKRLEIASPAFTVIEASAVARATSIELTFGGFEDD